MKLFQKTNPEAKAQAQASDLYKRNQDLGYAANVHATDDSFKMARHGQKSELTRWQQDLNDLVKEMVHRLKSEVKDDKGNWCKMVYIDQEGNHSDMPPIVNDEGTHRIVSIIIPNISKNLMMSRYSEDRINERIKELLITMTWYLLYNRHKYQIKLDDIELLIEIIKGFIEPTFFRAIYGNEKTYLSSIRKDTYIHTDHFQQQNKQKYGTFGS